MMKLKTYNQLFESGWLGGTPYATYPHVDYSLNLAKFFGSNKNIIEVMHLQEAIMGADTDISFIDIGEKNDVITYLSVNRFDQVNNGNYWESKYRQEMKFGRFIIKMYNDSHRVITNQKKQVDEIVDLYKAYREALIGKYDFKVIKGEEIKKWYSVHNYATGSGTLNNSCMRYDDEQNRLWLYTDNPDKISLLIMIDKNNKLLGRALLWELSNGEKYMDRTYTILQHHEDSFEMWADKNGINLTYAEVIDMIKEPKLSVILQEIGVSGDGAQHYPFMDTFKFCFPKEHLLTNYQIPHLKNQLYLDWF